MPELPEVETVCRGLAPVMEGRCFAGVEQNRPDLRIPFPPGFADRLAGRRVVSVGRRAKYILVRLEGGEVLVIHLGMSGRITIRPPGNGGETATAAFVHAGGEAGGPHDHVVFRLDDGTVLVYSDPRRFGLMTIMGDGEFDSHALFRHLGVEPLGNLLTAAHLNAALRGRRTPLKAALLDQKIVVGVGNIYACEALYRAGLSPRRSAASIATKGDMPGTRVERLVAAVRQVLAEAIEAGGSSLRDYVHTDGELGYFQHRFAVYDREGQPCRREGCGGTVRRIVQSGRSTFFCPSCQK